MADDTATPPAAETADQPKPGADQAPAPSGDPSAAKTLLTADSAEPAQEPAKTADVPAVPDKYDFSALKLPEGVELSQEIVDAVSPIFKKYGLSQEAAAELAQVHAEALAKVETDAETKREADFKQWMADNAAANINAARKEWGHEFEANLKVAQRGLARVFDADGKRLLDETGLGNHPSFLKAFLAVGKMIQEDTPPNGAQPSGRKPSAAVLYPSTPGAEAAH